MLEKHLFSRIQNSRLNNKQVKVAALAALLSSAATSTMAGEAPQWVQSMKMSGLIEFEANYVDGTFADDDASASDFTVATVAVGIESQINDRVSTEVAFLYEEDDTEFDVDVAAIHATSANNSALKWTFGQAYLPFGSFATNLINDTFALELAEAVETVAMATLDNGALTFQGYLFNGDVDKGNDSAENIGLRLAYKTDLFTVGVDYLNNAMDTDMATESFVGGGALDERSGAVSINGSYLANNLSLMFEYLSFDEIEITGGTGDGTEPEIIHLEMGLATQFGARDYNLGFAVQTTDDLVGMAPEQRISMGLSTIVMDDLTCGVELWHDSDYDTSDGGTDESVFGLVAQIAITF